MKRWIRHAAALAALASAAIAQAGGTVGNTLPADFPKIEDASLTGKNVLGFGAAGTATRTPVILLHGNNDTPFPTACNPFGRMQALAQHLADHGYATSELWGLGYEGDQCDLSDPTRRSSIAHTHAANVPDLRRFVRAVLAYTGARQVDIVGHSMGATLAREWMRQDEAYPVVRRLVSIDGPHHGIINCSPDPANYFQLPGLGGFTPSAELCQEVGSPDTPFLRLLNGPGGSRETMGPTRVLAIRNADVSFVYFPLQDGIFAPVPAIDSYGKPTDFSKSASLQGGREIALTGQGAHDPILGTAHLGILNSPATWQATLEFLTARR
jgi:pimeloyl-ACP methyl ester carboxylesterase